MDALDAVISKLREMGMVIEGDRDRADAPPWTVP